MSIPGIANPQWYEWYVGLKQLIRMINPDNNIEYVMFQAADYDTIDDIVVGYKNRIEMCYQVKHEISESSKNGMTFNKLITASTRRSGTEKKSLLYSLAAGWQEASGKNENKIIPVLYTNRNLGKSRSKRTFNEIAYNALPLGEFLEAIKDSISKCEDINQVTESLNGDLRIQWLEFVNALENRDVFFPFLKRLKIMSNMEGYEESEISMILDLKNTFACTENVARKLFQKLVHELRIWTTTRRKDSTKVKIEELYNVLTIDSDEEHGEHQLRYPLPFFESRDIFAQSIIKEIKDNNHKVFWVEGDPGSGKTSLISYLQLKYNLFSARYHTFRPISPEQKYYNTDAGLCSKESLWNDLLIQLRKKFLGRLHELNIPVTNSLCTTEQMRIEVLRLAKLLFLETGEKTVICIDGIDHAARANEQITFLDSLYLPSEIPDGVALMIVGQPSELYSNYPTWLKNSNDYVRKLYMPKLTSDDILCLLLEEKRSDFDYNRVIMAKMLYEKTQGNNLSVVFAIEELIRAKSLEEFEKILNSKIISPDVSNYYSHIWSYVKTSLSSKGLNIPFPDAVLGSIIILLNGRVNTEVLSCTFDFNFEKSDWEELLEQLFPLMKKGNKQNDYVIFHNDFRVFLMGIIKTFGKYKDVAFKLSNYYLENQDSLEGTINLIPLIISAEKEELIPSIFDTKFIINALTFGISKRNIEYWATLSYQSILKQKNWELFRTFYLAIKTLHQHERYFEYHERKYNENDKTHLKTLNIFDLDSKEITINNLEDFQNMFIFCRELVSLEDAASQERARYIFENWTESLSPTEFLNRLSVNYDLQYKLNFLEGMLENWAKLAVHFNIRYDDFGKKSQSSKMKNMLLSFNDCYFETSLLSIDSNDNVSFILSQGVSSDCLKKNIRTILFEGKSSEYAGILKLLANEKNTDNNVLLSKIALLSESEDFDQIEFSSAEKVKRIYSETSEKLIFLSILYGFQDCKASLEKSFGDLELLLGEVEEKKLDEYFIMLLRHGFILGRILGLEKENFNDIDTEKYLRDSYDSFFAFDLSRVRTFDYIKGFEVLLYLSLNIKCAVNLVDESNLIEKIELHLFHRNRLGMFYKSKILDFLLERNYSEIIINYLKQLYGENGNKIVAESDSNETHIHFKKYLKIMMPEFLNNLENRLKFDVVNFVGHKDYSLWDSSQRLKNIIADNPHQWSGRGLNLLAISFCADNKNGNRSSDEIDKIIAEASVQCGIEDFWRFNEISEYRLSLYILHYQLPIMIQKLTDIQQLVNFWLFVCGILSWYVNEDRIFLQDIYSKCLEKEKSFQTKEFEDVIKQVTPEHYELVSESEIDNLMQESGFSNDFSKQRDMKKNQMRISFHDMDDNEILNFLITENSTIPNWENIEIAWEVIEKRGNLSEEVIDGFAVILYASLPEYSWEQSGCLVIFQRLFSKRKERLLWEIAEKSLKVIKDEDNFYSLSSNLEFLLRYVEELQGIDFCKKTFDLEIQMFKLWVTGNSHIDVDFEISQTPSNLVIPQNLDELYICLLLEQLFSRNIHRIEISSQGLDLFLKNNPYMFGYIVEIWESLDEIQKEYLMKLSEKWIRFNYDGVEQLLYVFRKEYQSTNELDKKLRLHLLLLNLDFENFIGLMLRETYETKEKNYTLPKNFQKLDYKNSISVYTEKFLNIMDLFTHSSSQDIRNYIQEHKQVSTYQLLENASRNGDAMLYPLEYDELDMQVLYGESKKGRWNNIPYEFKAQLLLEADDPLVYSQVPHMDFSPVWDVESELKELQSTDNLVEGKKIMNEILYHNLPLEFDVIGGVIHYPISGEDFIIFREFASSGEFDETPTIDTSYNPRIVDFSGTEQGFNFQRKVIFNRQNSYSLVVNILGYRIFPYGNSDLYPSLKLIEELDLIPSEEVPLAWENTCGEIVLYYERSVAPIRKSMREGYYRQPLMSRWLLKKECLTKLNEVTYTNDIFYTSDY